MKRIILIDADDTAVKFRHKFMTIANELFGTSFTIDDCGHNYDCEISLKLTPEQEAKIWPIVESKGFTLDMDLMDGAGDAIEYLASKYEVAFLTKPFKASDTWVSDRYKWIEKTFGKALADNTIFTGAKHLADGDVLIDDRHQYVESWYEHRMRRNDWAYLPEPVVFAWPYNKEYRLKNYRTNAWADIVKFIEENL
jgi:5'(3')-deoxyribonucleotidase